MANAVRVCVVFLWLSLAPQMAVHAENEASCACVKERLPQDGDRKQGTGNAEVDKRLREARKVASRLFGVRPELLIVEGDAAYVCKVAADPESAGTIVLGRGLLCDECGKLKDAGPAVIAILAHEYAHILQWKHGCALTGKQRELHADFLAGHALGNRAFRVDRERMTSVRRFARDLFASGTAEFRLVKQHGTPAERTTAFLEGYKRRNDPVDLAYRKGEGRIRGDREAPDPFVAAAAKEKQSPPAGSGTAKAPPPKVRPMGRLKEIQVPCTHKVRCSHREDCRHRVRCAHEQECVHTTACKHRSKCVHRIDCTHKGLCVHTTPCIHLLHDYDLQHEFDTTLDGRRIQCQHRIRCCHGRHRFDYLHNWDPKHEFDLQHEYDLAHDFDQLHRSDFEHEYDLEHEFDMAHPHDLAHKFDIKRVPE